MHPVTDIGQVVRPDLIRGSTLAPGAPRWRRGSGLGSSSSRRRRGFGSSKLGLRVCWQQREVMALTALPCVPAGTGCGGRAVAAGAARDGWQGRAVTHPRRPAVARRHGVRASVTRAEFRTQARQCKRKILYDSIRSRARCELLLLWALAVRTYLRAARSPAMIMGFTMASIASSRAVMSASVAFGCDSTHASTRAHSSDSASRCASSKLISTLSAPWRYHSEKASLHPHKLWRWRTFDSSAVAPSNSLT